MPSVHGLKSLLAGTVLDLSKGLRVQVAGVSESLAELTALGLSISKQVARGEPCRVVVVLPTAKDQSSWMQCFDHAVIALRESLGLCASTLPSFHGFGNDRFINPALSRRQRLYTLSKLAGLDGGEGPMLIVTTIQALAQRTMAPSLLRGAALGLKTGDEMDQDLLIATLEDLGYTTSASVDEEGVYGVRGGIVDVFPTNSDDPVRIEMMGDEVASIRTFSPQDQRSKSVKRTVWVAPSYEALTKVAARKVDAQRLYDALIEQEINAADRDGMLIAFRAGARFVGFDMFAPLFRPEEGTGFDYLDERCVMLFPNSIETCLSAYVDFHAALLTGATQDAERHRPMMAPNQHFLTPNEALSRLERASRLVEFGNPYATQEGRLYRIESRLNLAGAPTSVSVGADLFDKWLLAFDEVLTKQGGSIAILCHQDEQIDRVRNLLAHRGLSPKVDPLALTRLTSSTLLPGEIVIARGHVTSHLWLDEEAVLVVPESSLFGTKPRRVKPASQKLQNYLSSFADLKADDLVVHVQHGIGRYKGMTSLTVAGLSSDFLVIEYSGGDKIYLPVDRLSLLQRYSVGAEGGAAHTTDKLGGPGWEKRKGRVRGAVRDMAEELLKIQAKRALARGHSYGAPDDAFVKFEAEFPFEETEDQLRALQDVDQDLRSGKPMDRLICGDVGFGKTEIALRAALRSVLEGFQVLVLVPTTVLCYQHYRTFESRLAVHGVRIAQVNRFVKGDGLKAALNGLEDGSVDVLVGTHRLLSQDVKPKRLGLLVVDEEQRFGVAHKEKLKELRAGAHIMTLTATPIPRTLHMAMVGLRDISIIATPPPDRLAVKTYISRFDTQLIKDAIEQEVRRGGQVFFVHNRVEDIEEMRLFLRSLVPHLEVRVGHGQMREQQLESVIVDFLEQKFPILLCTTIIESGIDMPNVNTLIVDRSDRYGLAQLYQLRGRVGRSNLQAYAYFLTPAEERLTDEGKQRLDVLAAHQDLGAGFQIASHDLELRGAGNLLGGEQSGHASAVGLELYTEMLESAINEARGEPVEERVDTEIKLPVSALIPSSYVPGESQRLGLYKRLFASESVDDLSKLRHEVEDRFGAPPPECMLLFRVARLKQLLRQLRALRLSASKDAFEVRFSALTPTQIDHLIRVVAREPGRYRLSPDYRLLLPAAVPHAPTPAQQDHMLQALLATLEPVAEGFA